MPPCKTRRPPAITDRCRDRDPPDPWDRGASTVREVHDSLGKTKPVGYTTILKQMQVMHRKRLLVRSDRFRAHVYEPAQPQSHIQRRLAASMLRQVFGGSATACCRVPSRAAR